MPAGAMSQSAVDRQHHALRSGTESERRERGIHLRRRTSNAHPGPVAAVGVNVKFEALIPGLALKHEPGTLPLALQLAAQSRKSGCDWPVDDGGHLTACLDADPIAEQQRDVAQLHCL